MIRKFLIVLVLVIYLVMAFAVFSSSPPIFAVIPLAAAVTIAHPVIKYVLKMKAPTPRLLCCAVGGIVTLLIASVSGLWQNVIKCPITTKMSKTFDYTFTTNSRFLTTQLNV